MWRQIGKLIFHIAAIVIPVVLAMEFFCAAFPNVYMDGEYAMYRQQKDYISNNTDYNRILILGDSRAKSCFKPDELGDDVYNISLGGISPVESYYMLKEYLEHHDAPEYLFLVYAPIHLCNSEENEYYYVLWNRCVYFHTFDREALFDIHETAKGFTDTEIIDCDHFYSEYLMYKLYFPNKYGTAMKKALFENRYRFNKEKYEQTVSDKGYSLFGTEGPHGGVNAEAKRSDFVPSDMIDFYYNKIFELCRENGIQAIVEQPPMLDISYKILQPDFKSHFSKYMDGLADNNPDIWIRTRLEVYPAEYFGDNDHLNPEGAARFCGIMKESYPQVFAP